MRTGIRERGFPCPGVSTDQDSAPIQFHAPGMDRGGIASSKMTEDCCFKKVIAQVGFMRHCCFRKRQEAEALSDIAYREVFTIGNVRKKISLYPAKRCWRTRRGTPFCDGNPELDRLSVKKLLKTFPTIFCGTENIF